MSKSVAVFFAFLLCLLIWEHSGYTVKLYALILFSKVWVIYQFLSSKQICHSFFCPTVLSSELHSSYQHHNLYISKHSPFFPVQSGSTQCAACKSGHCLSARLASWVSPLSLLPELDKAKQRIMESPDLRRTQPCPLCNIFPALPRHLVTASRATPLPYPRAATNTYFYLFSPPTFLFFLWFYRGFSASVSHPSANTTINLGAHSPRSLAPRIHQHRLPSLLPRFHPRSGDLTVRHCGTSWPEWKGRGDMGGRSSLHRLGLRRIFRVKMIGGSLRNS